MHAQLMEEVDHATNFDWTVAGSMLGQETQWLLTEEQRQLLYESGSQVVNNNKRRAEDAFETTTTAVPPGWSRRNVVSSRVLWARVRLLEQQETKLPQIRGTTDPLRVTFDDYKNKPNSLFQ